MWLNAQILAMSGFICRLLYVYSDSDCITSLKLILNISPEGAVSNLSQTPKRGIEFVAKPKGGHFIYG